MTETIIRESPERRLEILVGGRAQSLLKAQAAGSSGARATLARLRRATGKPVGSVPEVWGDTVGLLYEGAHALPAPHGDAPTRYERAAHLAMTLFATHQQSRPQAMHRQGVGLGEAVRLLGADPGSATRRRYDAVATAQSYDELAHHLRGIVQLLRASDIALDYGRLAFDLARFQDARGTDRVRLSWARQLYRTDKTENAAPTAETPTTENEENES